MIEPDYPRIMLSFTYHGCKIEIDRTELNGHFIYTAWVNHDRGYAVAVPSAMSKIAAIHQAKQWIDKRLGRM